MTHPPTPRPAADPTALANGPWLFDGPLDGRLPDAPPTGGCGGRLDGQLDVPFAGHKDGGLGGQLDAPSGGRSGAPSASYGPPDARSGGPGGPGPGALSALYGPADARSDVLPGANGLADADARPDALSGSDGSWGARPDEGVDAPDVRRDRPAAARLGGSPGPCLDRGPGGRSAGAADVRPDGRSGAAVGTRQGLSGPLVGAGRGPVEAVLFDRDGTLVVDVPYNGDPALVELMPSAREAVAAVRSLGIPVGVVSNQSGVARGLLSRCQVEAVQLRVEAFLGPFAVWAVCPHGPDDGCGCRKPAPGLVLAACERLGVSAARTVVIGDIGSDVAAARAAGARGVLVPTAKTRPEETEAAGAAGETAVDLLDAVRTLLSRDAGEDRRRTGHPNHAGVVGPAVVHRGAAVGRTAGEP